MTGLDLLIEPRDPAIFRDARPFETGLGARTLAWATPSAVIGTIRTRLGATTGFDAAALARLLSVRHVGPFLACETKEGWRLAFTPPADAVGYDGPGDQIEFAPLRPDSLQAFEGLDLPEGLLPLFGAKARKESGRAPRFWSDSFLLEWLGHTGGSLCRAAEEAGYSELERHRRMHVVIAENSRNAAEGMLFATEGLEFHRRAIFSRIEGDLEGLAPLEGLGPIGGEQRLAYWSVTSNLLPPAPGWVSKLKRIRLVLVTPAEFSGGWQPGWSRSGSPPEAASVKLKLKAAAVPRPMPISGWDYTVGGKRGQKPTRLLAPAGSVYFFEVEAGDPASLWLKSICDDEQRRGDGFGLVVVGRW